MFKKITKIIKRQSHGSKKDGENKSWVIQDINLISSFLANPDFPWLISFPRTGSHWLRMIMELYFKKPSLVRIFFYKDSNDFTCFHRHDIDLIFNGCRNVIYLYRNPVDTIFSQIKYDDKDIYDLSLVRYWCQLYGKHLSKWLIEETFTKQKTIISYEELKENIHRAFEKVCKHFEYPFNPQKLDMVLPMISKNTLKDKTEEEPNIVNLTTSYENDRDIFREKYSSTIYENVFNMNEDLRNIFNI